MKGRYRSIWRGSTHSVIYDRHGLPIGVVTTYGRDLHSLMGSLSTSPRGSSESSRSNTNTPLKRGSSSKSTFPSASTGSARTSNSPVLKSASGSTRIPLWGRISCWLRRLRSRGQMAMLCISGSRKEPEALRVRRANDP